MTKRYDEYKKAELPWLDEIPKNWKINGISHLTKNIKTGTTPKTSVSEYFESGDVNWFRPTDISKKSILEESSKKITHLAVLDGEVNLQAGDSLILNTIGGNLGNVSYVKTEHATNQQITNIKFKENNKYYFYLFNSLKKYINCLANNTTIPQLNNDNLKKLYLLIPSKTEQQAIADYLDNKTSKIDSAVAELEKQKSLLIELKKSTIHQAVTKGLDLTVPMKDSGVEWIGEVPRHWTVNSLKNFVNYKTGNTPDSNNQSYYSENGFEWVNISDLGNKTLPKTKKMLSKDGVDSKNLEQVKSNSLLYSFKLSVGLCSITDRPVYTNEAIAAFEENHKVDVRFLYYSLGSHFYNNAKENIYGAPLLNRTLIENGKYTAPNKTEQQAIATYLDKKTGQIDKSIEVIDNQIAKMKEYKKTLINDVVTGKIKVV